MKEDLEFICQDFKIKAKQAIETHKKRMSLESDSAEYRIQSEIFTNIIKELTKYAEIIYSTILSYNNNLEEFSVITKEDVLRFQLLQDEVTSMLKENGIHVNYVHPNDKK